MTKADLVDLIYERVGSSKKEACEVVEAVFAIIKDSLRSGQNVKISGFGTFRINHKHARRGRNPQTGQPITIDSRRVLSFKASQVLKDRVNNGAKTHSDMNGGSEPEPEE
jgi:integration host factor subunit alpha